MRPSFSRVCCGLSLFVLLLLAAGSPVFAGTTFIREIARSSAKVLIVSSGPLAQGTAQAFKTSILTHPETKKNDGDIKMVSLSDGAGDIAAYGSKNTIIFCLAGREITPDKVTALQGMVAQNGELIGTRTSFVYGKITEKGAGKPAFSIAVYAPDAERLARLRPRLDTANQNSFRDLALSETWRSNRIAVFAGSDSSALLHTWGAEGGFGAPGISPALQRRASAPPPSGNAMSLQQRLGLVKRPSNPEPSRPEPLPTAIGGGGGGGTSFLWDDVRFYTLADRDKLSPEDLEERNEVYFINRGTGETLPAARADLLTGLDLKPTTIAVRSRQDPDGDFVAVLSSPNANHINIRASRRYTTLPALMAAPETEELIDLRVVKTSGIRILGNFDDKEKDQVRAVVAAAIRQTLNVQVQEGGTFLRELQSVVSTDQLLGGTGVELSKKLGVQYVWVFNLSEYAGQTKYDSRVTRMTPPPTTFDKPYPPEPTEKYRKESDADFNKRRSQWSSDVNEWNRQKQEHEQQQSNATAEFSLVANEIQVGSAQGMLQLVDLNNKDVAGAVVWECTCGDAKTDTRPYKTDVRHQPNRDREPQALDVPAPQQDCPPALRYEAAKNAALSGLQQLNEKALLPSSLPGQINNKENAGSASGTTGGKSPNGNVVDIDGKTITVSVGTENGVRVGQRIKVILKTRQITDTDGKVISTRVVDFVTLKVTTVDAHTADCVAATTADTAKLGLIKVGMPLQKLGQ